MLQIQNPISIKIQYSKKLNVQNVHTNEKQVQIPNVQKVVFRNNQKNIVESY